MARPLADEIRDLVASGQATKRQGNKFGTRVRNVDQDPWEVGDQFTIPAGYEVLEMSINGSDPVPFIMVTVQNKNTNVVRNMRFFPNQMAKTIRPVVNGQLQNKLKTGGNAAKFYQKYADQGDEGMDNAVNAIVGHPIEITAKTPYQVYAYGTTNIENTALYEYSWVGAGPNGQQPPQGVVGA